MHFSSILADFGINSRIFKNLLTENAGHRQLPCGKAWDISVISPAADILFPVDSIPAPVPQISAPSDWSDLWSGRILAGVSRSFSDTRPR